MWTRLVKPFAVHYKYHVPSTISSDRPMFKSLGALSIDLAQRLPDSKCVHITPHHMAAGNVPESYYESCNECRHGDQCCVRNSSKMTSLLSHHTKLVFYIR